jgi:hypothetical protein
MVRAKLLTGFVVVAAILGMVALLGFAKGNKEAPSDSTHSDTTIANSTIAIDTSLTRPRGILAQEYKSPVLPPFRPQTEMGAEFGFYDKHGNYTKGRVAIRSEDDLDLLRENGFLLHRKSPIAFPGTVSYEGAWPIDLDLNTLTDLILAVEYEKAPERLPFPPQREMGFHVTVVIDGVEYTEGMVTVKSTADSIVLVEHGFLISGGASVALGSGLATYFAKWPINLDLNTIFDHVIGVGPEGVVTTPD